MERGVAGGTAEYSGVGHARDEPRILMLLVRMRTCRGIMIDPWNLMSTGLHIPPFCCGSGAVTRTVLRTCCKLAMTLKRVVLTEFGTQTCSKLARGVNYARSLLDVFAHGGSENELLCQHRVTCDLCSFVGMSASSNMHPLNCENSRKAPLDAGGVHTARTVPLSITAEAMRPRTLR